MFSRSGKTQLIMVGSGRVGCLQVELYLPSLLKDGLAVGIFLLLTPDNFLYYHEQIHNFTTTFLCGKLLLTVITFRDGPKITS